jgi:hypothetical protein
LPCNLKWALETQDHENITMSREWNYILGARRVHMCQYTIVHTITTYKNKY